MRKMKPMNKALASTAVVTLVLNAMTAIPALAADANYVGTDRIDTAIKIAEASWQGAWNGSTNAVIVQKDDDHLVDALAVAPLAYKLQAPILLSDKGDQITKETMDQLKKNGVKKVYLATGSGVITDKAKAQLEAEGMQVERLGGNNRYETAKNIAEKLGTTSKVAVVNGEVGLADALSVASIAASEQMTIALSSGKDNEPTTTNLEGKEVYAIGGTGVISEKLATKMGAVRYGGSTRYETNTAVVNGFKDKVKFDNAYLANGDSSHLVDALTGSVLAAQTKAPIILTSDAIGVSQAQLLDANLKSDTSVITVGGSVKKAVVASVKQKVQEKVATLPTATLVNVDNSLMGTSIVEVSLNVTDPQNYDVAIKGQTANYYAGSKTFKIASAQYLEAKDINVKNDVTITKKASNATATLVGVDNSLMGTSIVEVRVNAEDPQNYMVTIKGQTANYYAASKTFKIASSAYLEAKDIDMSKDVIATKKAAVTANLVGVDNSLMGTSIVEISLNAANPQSYDVKIKGQSAKYYESSKSFKIASSSYLEAKDIDLSKDVVITLK